MLCLPCVLEVIPCWLCLPGSGACQLFATLPEKGNAAHSVRWSYDLELLEGFGVGCSFSDGGCPSSKRGCKPGGPLSCAVGVASWPEGLGGGKFGSGSRWELLGCVIDVVLWCHCQSCSLDLHFECNFANKCPLPSPHVSTGACKGFVLAAFFSCSCSLSRCCQLNGWDLTGL